MARRSDLACERRGAFSDLAGCRYREEAHGLCRYHVLDIDTAEAAHACQCEVGHYLTQHFPPVFSLLPEEVREVAVQLADRVGEEASALLGSADLTGRRILVAGLGNPALTADALGPACAARITPTAHLSKERPGILADLAAAALAVLVPGVTAQTGLESTSLLRAAATAFSPELIVTVDALAARSPARLAATVQLTDTGVAPGSGVGGDRARIDRREMGCPVLSIGAPTVIDAAALLTDLLEDAGVEATERLAQLLKEKRRALLCPHEADAVCARLAAIIALAINRAFGIPDLDAPLS